MLHGDLLRIEHAGGTSWTLLRSSQGHAPDYDDDILGGGAGPQKFVPTTCHACFATRHYYYYYYYYYSP